MFSWIPYMPFKHNFFWQSPDPKWIITMPRHNLKQLLRLFTKANFVTKTCTCFTFLRDPNWEECGVERAPGAQSVGVSLLMGDVDDKSLKEELETCKRFLLDSEIENGRHRLYNFAMDFLEPKSLLEKNVVFESLEGAAKLDGVIRLCVQNCSRREL